MVVVAGAVAVSFKGSAAGGSISTNILSDTTKAYADQSSITSDSGDVQVTAGWSTPTAPVPIDISTPTLTTTTSSITLPTLPDSASSAGIISVSVNASVSQDVRLCGCVASQCHSQCLLGHGQQLDDHRG